MLVPTNEPGIGPIARAAFPDNRKPIQVCEFRGPQNVNSYWDGGSKDEYRLVHLVTGQVWHAPTSHPHFDRKEDGSRCGGLEIRELPENVALVSGGYFCGKPATITVHLRPENMVKMLPAPQELAPDQQAALNVICGIKSSYRAAEFERRQLGRYSADNPHLAALVARGLLKINKAGAISPTIAGENARQRLY
jgi:hypothetical protein